MKIDLTMNSVGFARHIGHAAHDENKATLGNRVWSALRRAKDRLVGDLRPTSDEEAFLAKSQNHADLERRILMLQNPDRHQSGW